MASRRSLFTATAVAAGTAALAYASYRKDIKAARERITKGRHFIDSPEVPIEFAETGNGPAVLVIHGAGGGFDQGLDLGRGLVGDDYRIVAPSRFGYLGTPIPEDPSPQAQADAHARLLDALGLDKVPVIGISAGGPSAMQLCLRHPDRCTALALIVPMAFTEKATRELSPAFEAVLNAVASSDFIFWTAMKVAHSLVLKTILGTPVEVYRGGTDAERAEVDAIFKTILPISKRFSGIWNDGVVSSALDRFELEEIRVPTLVVSSADDLYGTYDSSRYTAEHIPGAKFVGFASGGHLLIGHGDEVRLEVRSLLQRQLFQAA